MGRLVLGVLGIALVWASQIPNAQASPTHRASLSTSYAGFIIDEDIAPMGGVISAEYEYFFSDAFAVRLGAGGGYFLGEPDEEDHNGSYTGHAVIGATYLIDNLKYVPYGTVGIGALSFTDSRIEPGMALFVEGGGGIDVILNRSVAVGLTFKFEAQLSRVAFFTAGARVVYRWGD